MMTSTPAMTKFQIPIEVSVLDAIKAKAIRLGFDSAQAYVRVWAKADAEGRVVNYDTETLSDAASKRYKKMLKEFESDPGSYKSFDNVDDFMKDLLS